MRSSCWTLSLNVGNNGWSGIRLRPTSYEEILLDTSQKEVFFTSLLLICIVDWECGRDDGV